MAVIFCRVSTFGATGGGLGALEALERGDNKGKRKRFHMIPQCISF